MNLKCVKCMNLGHRESSVRLNGVNRLCDFKGNHLYEAIFTTG